MLSSVRRGIYFVLGLLALFLTLLAPLRIYSGIWAYTSGSDTSGYSLLHFVLLPVCGTTATVSGLIVLLRRRPHSNLSRLVHTFLLCIGILTAAYLVWPAGDFGFRVFGLLPALVAAMLVRHLWKDTAQPGIRAGRAKARPSI